MKTKLALIGMLSLALGACDQKETKTTVDTGKPEAPRFKPTESRPDRVPLAPPQERLVETLSQVIEPLTTFPETQEQLDARRTAALEERKARIVSRLNEKLEERDSNNDGKLGKDEVQGTLRQRFIEADVNADGFLDPAEQETMVLSIAERFGEGEPSRRFRGNQGAEKDP